MSLKVVWVIWWGVKKKKEKWDWGFFSFLEVIEVILEIVVVNYSERDLKKWLEGYSYGVYKICYFLIFFFVGLCFFMSLKVEDRYLLGERKYIYGSRYIERFFRVEADSES